MTFGIRGYIVSLNTLDRTRGGKIRVVLVVVVVVVVGVMVGEMVLLILWTHLPLLDQRYPILLPSSSFRNSLLLSEYSEYRVAPTSLFHPT